jgi:tRNA(Ile)-lysidine synthase
MLKKVKEIIEKHNMLNMEDRIVVAVSGGPDSVALLKMLTLISAEYRLSLIAAHLNHGLRGEESDAEEAFVGRLSKSMGIACETEYIDIAGLIKRKSGSVEDICRNERYKFLEKTRKNHKASKIALGHTLNDQAETVVMKFLRGSGMRGLRGILPVRDEICIRPLIAVGRDEILTFLRKEGLKYVVDSSNIEDFYLRNRIRNRLIPILKENYNPRLEENLGHMADIIRSEDDYIGSAVENVLTNWRINSNKSSILIKIPELVKLHEALQRRVIKRLLEDCSRSDKPPNPPFSEGGMGGSLSNPIGYLHVKSVMDMIACGRPNAALNLPSGLKVRREYDQLQILKKQKRGQASAPVGENGEFCYAAEIPGRVEIKELGIKVDFDLVDKTPALNFDAAHSAFMDYEKISFPLAIRNIRPGDRIQPFGMKGTKKINAFFIDQKMPENRRKKIPLLVDRKSVLWIMGIRLCERVRITDKTRKILRVRHC